MHTHSLLSHVHVSIGMYALRDSRRQSGWGRGTEEERPQTARTPRARRAVFTVYKTNIIL